MLARGAQRLNDARLLARGPTMAKQYEIDRIVKGELQGASEVALFYHSKAGSAEHHGAQREQLLFAADTKNVPMFTGRRLTSYTIADHGTFSSETSFCEANQHRAACLRSPGYVSFRMV